MKKEHIKPSISVVDMETPAILAGSLKWANDKQDEGYVFPEEPRTDNPEQPWAPGDDNWGEND